MKLTLGTADRMGAVSVAKEAAPYVHSKLGATPGETAIPLELLPEPKPDYEADEPGPENVIE